ncbi:fimbria/pilus periplasmic chaperone [Klebsiella aerogenes]|uniref:fimbrial biogenesis chaperone n=1 Tax=Klebsiella aerogenes TaxID=548 RepID=UPI0028DE78AF|nr:fimbria/pilus periplasmic chaperone [Klebsiella aerogenes]MDT8885892.1 fimbria/pilus periplasmic chaperone [Klebsiella aerogenes]MDU2098364.1 fimbria/pilus periplasmic chaperone [Staphylococcus sp.]
MHQSFTERVIKNFICLIFVFIASVTHANTDGVNGISFYLTRLIITEKDTEGIFFSAHNNNPFPVLIQAWSSHLDTQTGMVSDLPSKEKIPFIALPPLQRVEPGENFTLQLRLNGNPVSSLKESVYLLSFKAIPVSGPRDANQLLMTVVTNLKVFVRNNIPNSDGFNSAVNKISASWSSEGIIINNTSPYWLTFSSMKLDDKELDKKLLLKMAAPMQSTLFKMDEGKPHDLIIKLIDDYGMETSPISIKVE